MPTGPGVLGIGMGAGDRVDDGVYALPSCGSTCSVRVYFKQRTALCSATNYCDFYIHKVEALGSCSGCPSDFVFATGIQNLIEDPIINTCLPGIGCTDAIRVFMGACWQHAEGEPGQVVTDSWTACDDVECCFARYRVCRVGGAYFSQQITPPSFTGDCTKFVDPACEPWCEKAPKGAPPPETKGVLNGAAELAAEHIVVQPNPSRDMLAVSVINPVSLNGTIMVTDLRGANVDIEPIIVQDGNITHFELNVSRLAAGTYVYTLTRTDGTSVSGRFVVTR